MGLGGFNGLLLPFFFLFFLLVYKMITPSNNQTKEWRKSQPWHLNGKHNECEKYQISLIEETTGVKVDKTNKRINLITNQLEDVKKKN